MLQPTTIPEAQEMIRATTEPLVVRGGGSKPTLSTAPAGAATIDVSQLSGILAYDPGEYTFTALAGTAVSTINAALAQHGQYLPFDPILAAQGATIGGVVASNTAGSGRYRYGGVRDFILGVRFVDGRGELVRGGGQVVKNSAGFDLPKFMVGSLGRYGLLAEVSFKVFPQPQAYTTLFVDYASLAEAVAAIYKLATTPLEMDALDLEPQESGQQRLVIRLGGLPQALAGRIERVRAWLVQETAVLATHALHEDLAYWQQQNSFTWANPTHALIKVPLTPKQIAPLRSTLPDFTYRATAGGHVLWLSGIETQLLHELLRQNGMIGLQIWGSSTQTIIGQRKGIAMAQRVKQALDPAGRFLGF